MKRNFLLALLAFFSFPAVFAAEDMAPAVPDLTLPAESELAVEPDDETKHKKQSEPAQNVSVPAPKSAAQKRNGSKKTSSKKTARSSKKPSVPPVTKAAAKINTEEIVVENLMNQPQPVKASLPAPAEQAASAASDGQKVSQNTSAPAAQAPVKAQAAAPSAKKAPAAAPVNKEPLVVFNPKTDRDPTLSPDDTLLIRHREEERLRAIEAERQSKIEAERRRLAELERQRQLELERLRDPSREIRGKIRISGIIGQEAFIGNKIYSVGQSVLGARIVSVQPDAVVFTYKGQKFTKRVELK